jgi:F-type H+-transporting ATPase subunit epsilon
MTNDALKQQIDRADSLKDTMKVDIVSAEEMIYSGRAKVIVAPGQDGELGIFPGHSQLLASLKPGEIRLYSAEGEESFNYYVSGGFIEIQPYHVTVLADTVIRAEDIDEEKALKAKEQAEKILATTQKLDNYAIVLIELTKAMAQLKIAKKYNK